MDFERNWHTFSLDAEVDAFGTSRIAGAHNRLREELERERDEARARSERCLAIAKENARLVNVREENARLRGDLRIAQDGTDQFLGERDSMRLELEKALARVEAVLALHWRRPLSGQPADGTHYCAHCGVGADWPCATVRALEGEP